MDCENEIWKDVIGYEGLYAVSNLGRIKSYDKIVKTKKLDYIRKGKILEQHAFCNGYLKTKLYNGSGKFWNTPVHRLVATVFIENPNNYPIINHIDGDKTNNHIDNLEWCTQSHNNRHAYRTGLKRLENYTGEGNPTSKLTTEQVLSIRREYSAGTTSINKLAKKYNTVAGNIYFILKRQTWKYV